MSKIISFTGQPSIVSSSMKQIKAGIEATGKKVVIIQIKLPAKDDASPYIASTYDTNARYDKVFSLFEKHKDIDYILVSGYTLDTMFTQIPKLPSISAMKSYCYWLDAIESVTYSIPRADEKVIIGSNKNKQLKLIKSVLPYDVLSVDSKNISELTERIVIAKNYKNEEVGKKRNATLFDVIATLGKGASVPYAELISPTEEQNPDLYDLLTLRKLVSKELGEDQYYSQIIQPLGTPYSINSRLQGKYSTSIAKVIDSFEGNFIANENKPTITFMPRNELQLVEQIGWEYGFDTSNLTYIEKTRILETWTQSNHRNNDVLQITCRTILSYYDIFSLIKNVPGIKVTMQRPSAHLGYIDISSAPTKITEAIEYAFDQSTKLCAISQNSDYLLMGHKSDCLIVLNFMQAATIIKSEEKNKSELFQLFSHQLKDALAITFPSIQT